MSYRVLARTYRSNTFDEIVGQESIATTLKNAVASGRVHHGYLFTGTRGVGKTSMARILAKALNCLDSDAPTTTPCCQCDSCVAIAIGEDMDVIEIDAASNTGVDNIRELRTNAMLRPARARFKVYIIDEVHMLSTGAFNALLKTLEEPPSHVKFILATTESHKVPATIKSRCQRFDFHAIDAASIAAHLRRILDAEKVRADDDVLRRIARLGHGSMRDALSLLDKLLSYEPNHLTAAVAEELMPPPHDELAAEVIQCIAESDAAGALGALDRALQSGRTVERFCSHLIDHVRTLMLLHVCGEDTELADVSGALRPKLAEQASRFDAPTYVYMITLLEELRRNVRFSGAARALADAAVVRLSMCEQFTQIGDLLARLDGEPSGGAAAAKPSGAKKKIGEGHHLENPAASPGTGAGTEPLSGPGRPLTSSTATGPQPAARTDTPSSTQLNKVARDPLVQRVKDAVDGTVTHVRAMTPAPQADTDAEELVEENSPDEPRDSMETV